MKLICALIVAVCIFLNTNAQSGAAVTKIYFSPDKYLLTGISKDSLKSFIERYAGVKHLVITGRCDKRGDDPLNDNLSIKRAMAVLDFLVTHGFPPSHIDSVVGLGKRDAIEPYSPNTDSLNRTVWITFSLDTDSMANQHTSTAGTNITRKDTFIHVYPPYALRLRGTIYSPKKGDTLLTDTSVYEIRGAIFLTRRTFIADDSAHIYDAIAAKEISYNIKRAAIAKAFMDTVTSSNAGQAIIIRSLSFEFGYHTLSASDLPALQAVLSALKSMPSLAMEIRGHICCVEQGGDAFDKQSSQYNLSVNRAKEIYNYLLANGADSSQLSYAGYGMKQPLVTVERTKNDQYKNRRIEFFITRK